MARGNFPGLSTDVIADGNKSICIRLMNLHKLEKQPLPLNNQLTCRK